MQFNVRDWLTDEHLKLASASTRGIWIDMLCQMWLKGNQGYLSGTEKVLFRVTNCTKREWNLFKKDAENHPFCDISWGESGQMHITNRWQKEG